MHIGTAGILVIAALAFCAAQDPSPDVAGAVSMEAMKRDVIAVAGPVPDVPQAVSMEAMKRDVATVAGAPRSIADGLSSFVTLKALLAAVGLDTAFGACAADFANATARFIVFAPTDAAFQALPAPVSDFLTDKANAELLKAILLGHVAKATEAQAAAFTGGAPLATLGTESLSVGKSPADAKNYVNSKWRISDSSPITFCDGVVYPMDEVIFPSSFVPQLEALRQAIGSDGAVVKPTTVAEATFQVADGGWGVTGFVRFIQPNAGGKTQVIISLQASGSTLNAGRKLGAFAINEKPTNAWTARNVRCSVAQIGTTYDPTEADDCNAGVGAIGDLSCKFGNLSTNSEGKYQNKFEASDLALNGPLRIVDRSVVIYDGSNLPWICATIVTAPAPNVVTLGPVSLPYTTLAPDTIFFATDAPTTTATPSLDPTHAPTAEPVTPTPTNPGATQPPTEEPSTPAPSAPPKCPLTYDLNCFDPDLYECNGCCETGFATDKKTSCWDSEGQYTRERCCSQSWQSDSLSQNKDRYATFCPAVRDVTCFDDIYICHTCCTTGKSIYNLTCWDKYYTKDRCCNDATAGVQQPVWQQPSIVNQPPVNQQPVYVQQEALKQSSTCADTNQMCAAWAATGECGGVSAAWVRNSCPSSCGSCWGGRRQAVRGLRLDSEGSLVDSRGNLAPSPQQVQQLQSNGVNVLAVSLGSVGGGLFAVLAVVAFFVARRVRARQSTPVPDMELSAQTAASTV